MLIVKDLTKKYDDGTASGELKMGIIAMENKCYEQAWKHFAVAARTGRLERTRGHGCYMLYYLMKFIDDDHNLIKQLKTTETDLAKVLAQKEVGNEYARRYIARKYLEKSAQYGYDAGLIDYSLMCAGYGLFPYKDEMKNLLAALDWADVMLKHEDPVVRSVANSIYAKYYYLKRNEEYKEMCKLYGERGEKYSPSKETLIVKDFGDYALKAYELCPTSEYAQFYLSILYSNVLFSGYQNGKYYNPKAGYDILKKNEKEGFDEHLRKEVKDVLKVLEKHFPKYKR